MSSTHYTPIPGEGDYDYDSCCCSLTGCPRCSVASRISANSSIRCSAADRDHRANGVSEKTSSWMRLVGTSTLTDALWTTTATPIRIFAQAARVLRQQRRKHSERKRNARADR